MKIKVLAKTRKNEKGQEFYSFFTPVTIMVKGEEDKGVQQKTLDVKFTKEADKQLPVNFKGGIIDADGENVGFPFVYEVKTNEDGSKEYPTCWIRKINSVSPLKPRENTCTFLVDEDDTPETSIEN